ncbi:MAG: glycosyltransferase family 9 protein [candidate division Zixibacteria bacterium]|nr:glycosyltransferase family 9 protein [candidate division Zixibacteria bacterium]
MKSIEHLFKKIVLGIANFLFNKKLAISDAIDITKVENILIYRPEKIGDLFVSLPLMAALKTAKPQMKIDIIISPTAYPLIAGDRRFHEIFLYKKSLWRDLVTARRIRKNNYDLIIDLVYFDSTTAAISVIYFSKKRAPKIAVGKKKFTRYYDLVYEIFEKRHMIESILQPLKLFGIFPASQDYFVSPHIDSAAKIRAQNFVAEFKLDHGSILMGINISAGERNRVWPIENYRALLNELRQKLPNLRPIVFAAPEDYEKAVTLTKDVPKAVVIPPGLSLLGVSALIPHLGLFISSDTSLIHIARSFHIPVVGLYIPYNENFKRWRPLGQNYGVLVAPNNESIDKISLEAVVEEIRRVMRETQ